MNSKTIIPIIVIYLGMLVLLYIRCWKKKHNIEEFTNVDDILKGMFKDPEKTSKMFTKLLGKKGNLGYYDVRDPKKLNLLEGRLNEYRNEYKQNIPLPNFDKRPKNIKKIPKKKIKKGKNQDFKDSKNIRVKKIVYQDYCRLVSTDSKNGQCPKEYPVFLGAQFSGKNIKCDRFGPKKKSRSKINYCRLCCKNEI